MSLMEEIIETGKAVEKAIRKIEQQKPELEVFIKIHGKTPYVKRYGVVCYKIV